MIKPQNGRIFLKKPDTEKSIGGFVYEDKLELHKYTVAEIVAVASDVEYKKGQTVVIPAYADVLKHDNTEYLICHWSDVVAVV